MKKQELPQWFDAKLYPEGAEVQNPLTGESARLSAEELSMYDYIKGLEVLAVQMPGLLSKTHQQNFSRAIRWFQKSNLEAYMKLLD